MNAEFTAFLTKVDAAVAGWFRDQCHNEFGAYYAYIRCKQPGNVCGDIIIATDCPDGYELGSPTRISPAWERRYALRQVYDWAKQWPVI